MENYWVRLLTKVDLNRCQKGNRKWMLAVLKKLKNGLKKAQKITKTMKRNIILFAGLLAIVGIVVAYMMYNKPHTDVGSSDAQFEMTADELFAAFDSDYDNARTKYEDQVILVSGQLHSLDMGNEEAPQLLLMTSFDDGYIRCGFDASYSEIIEDIDIGTKLKIKGICKGMDKLEGLDLLNDIDVVLSNCIIID